MTELFPKLLVGLFTALRSIIWIRDSVERKLIKLQYKTTTARKGKLLLLLRGGTHKASHTLRPFLICYASPSELFSHLIHPPELSAVGSRDLVGNQEKLGEKWP
jgi:hypothetical protein